MTFPRLGGVIALVVEDHADTREMFKEGMAACGAGVLSVASGDEALRLARHVLPDVVIVDIAMPEHDGFWVISELRKLPGAESVPVIAISGAPLDLVVRAEGRGHDPAQSGDNLTRERFEIQRRVRRSQAIQDRS